MPIGATISKTDAKNTHISWIPNDILNDYVLI